MTLGDNVVDTFYLCEADGRKIAAASRRDEIERALLAAVS